VLGDSALKVVPKSDAGFRVRSCSLLAELEEVGRTSDPYLGYDIAAKSKVDLPIRFVADGIE
jgi:hypothetical protein